MLVLDLEKQILPYKKYMEWVVFNSFIQQSKLQIHENLTGHNMTI